jgi:outer membrane protein assembly factor BamD (BamD/ComL family)
MMSLEEGLKALQQQNYAEAVKLLESYCQQSTDFGSPLYIQGKMALARAYRGNNQLQNAMDLGIELEEHLDREVSSWASAFLSILSA